MVKIFVCSNVLSLNPSVEHIKRSVFEWIWLDPHLIAIKKEIFNYTCLWLKLSSGLMPASGTIFQRISMKKKLFQTSWENQMFGNFKWFQKLKN